MDDIILSEYEKSLIKEVEAVAERTSISPERMWVKAAFMLGELSHDKSATDEGVQQKLIEWLQKFGMQ
jgi:hypothetical protein